MTLIKLTDEEITAEAILATAESHYLSVLEELETLKLYFRDRTDLSEAEIRRVLTEFRRATQTLFDERKRLEEIRKREAGIANDYAIDFADVRREIGRRLDRLRAAKSSK